MFPVSSARMFQDRSVATSPARNVRTFLASSATMLPDRSQGRSARVFLVNSVRMFLGSSAIMFHARSVRMFPANSASRFPSRFVRLLSLHMESRKTSFSKRVQSRNISIKTNPQVTPHLPPKITNVEDRNYSQLSSQRTTLFIAIENHIYFIALIL